jgi:hypothetical protein
VIFLHIDRLASPTRRKRTLPSFTSKRVVSVVVVRINRVPSLASAWGVLVA